MLESLHNCQNNINIPLNNTVFESKTTKNLNDFNLSTKSIVTDQKSSAFHIIDLMDKLVEREDHIRQVLTFKLLQINLFALNNLNFLFFNKFINVFLG